VFEITFGELRNPNLHLAINAMLSTRDYPNSKAAYHAAKLAKLFSEEAKTCDQVFVGLLEKEGVDIKPDGTYEVPDEKVKGWATVHEDFCKTTVNIGADKFPADALPGGLAPSQILALEPIIVE
jgi:hypothetical protein